MTIPAAILVVDDDEAVTTSLVLLLKQAGYRPRSANSPENALKTLQEGAYDLVLQDMNFSRRTSGEEGLALLGSIKGRFPHIPIVLMTAWGSVELAVKGVKAGATDFITKPWTHQQILLSVRTALGLAEVRSSDASMAEASRAELDAKYDFSGIIGEDLQFRRSLQTIGRVAATDAPVLITGESGTGKEIIAEAVWRNSSRREQTFVKVNLAGIATSLFESEIFGHVKGAFTDARSDRQGRFEAADHGTLFLDEIGDLDPSCQVKLLRVLQDRSFERVGSSDSISVDVRIVSATNRDLDALIESGHFREDLLYRLNLIRVHLPPLRKRRSDIPLLAAHILHQLSQNYERPELGVANSGLDWLMAQSWPGNIRQLKHIVERTVLLSGSQMLTADTFAQASDDNEQPSPGDPSLMTLDEMERQMIVASMNKHDGNLTRVAENLGLSRGALYRRLEKHGIST